ncbi:MAG: hypothetical protein WBF52_10990 [Geitlerinemataceae cyanobacterium]
MSARSRDRHHLDFWRIAFFPQSQVSRLPGFELSPERQTHYPDSGFAALGTWAADKSRLFDTFSLRIH